MGFRLEDKIRYHISDYVKLKNEIKKINGRLLFPKRKISSLYFDNKNLDMFNDSEEGNVPRKKIRYRFYPDEKEKKYYYEKKINSAEGKFKESQERKFEDYKLESKNGLFDHSYGILEKKIMVTYTREYYSIEDARITIDYLIKYTSPNGINEKTDYESLILEVKSQKKIIEVQNKFLNVIPLRRERISKYCEGINVLFNRDYMQRMNSFI